jgi:hypothetical protein
MVIDLRALGTRDFGHLWILACRLYDKTGDTFLDKHIENNTLHIRWNLNLNTVCTTPNLARG